MKKLFAKSERPEKLQTVFRYERLKSTEIRLLRLQPSTGRGHTKPLSGNLKTIRLPEYNDSVPTRFEALSYFWGDEAADRTLSLDNALFSIKPNLEAALRVLSKGEVERILWIDAICINQADLNERNEQVRIMSSIYQQATRVIVWLGLGWPGGKHVAAEAIKEFAKRQSQGADSQQLSTFLDNPHEKMEVIRHRFFDDNYCEPVAIDHNGGHWPVLVDFFDRPWWRRVWVRYVPIHSSSPLKSTSHLHLFLRRRYRKTESRLTA